MKTYEIVCKRTQQYQRVKKMSLFDQFFSIAEEACLVWCQKRNGGTKSRGWTFPDGTACQTRRNRYGRASYCIKGRCEEFTCDSFDETAFALSPDLCPIDKDDNEITWRTSLRRREAVRWKSASGCHYNCISPGSGIRLVTTKGKSGKSSIQLCQPDKYVSKTAFAVNYSKKYNFYTRINEWFKFLGMWQGEVTIPTCFDGVRKI